MSRHNYPAEVPRLNIHFRTYSLTKRLVLWRGPHNLISRLEVLCQDLVLAEEAIANVADEMGKDFKPHCQVMLKANCGFDFWEFFQLIKAVSGPRLDMLRELRGGGGGGGGRGTDDGAQNATTTTPTVDASPDDGTSGGRRPMPTPTTTPAPTTPPTLALTPSRIPSPRVARMMARFEIAQMARALDRLVQCMTESELPHVQIAGATDLLHTLRLALETFL